MRWGPAGFEGWGIPPGATLLFTIEVLAIAECAAAGVTLEMTHIDIPESITLGIVDERDAAIEQICKCIEAAGRAGLRGLNYNFLVGAAYARTEEHEATRGRGGR